MSALTLRCVGKTLAAVLTNGHVLQLRMTDGSELSVAWADDNGAPIKGKPVLAQAGVRLQARGVQDLIHLPGAARMETAP